MKQSSLISSSILPSAKILLFSLAYIRAQEGTSDTGQVQNDDLILGIMCGGTLIVFIFIILALIICFFRDMTKFPNMCIFCAAALPLIVGLILL